jgi:hypothetical protein
MYVLPMQISQFQSLLRALFYSACLCKYASRVVIENGKVRKGTHRRSPIRGPDQGKPAVT